MREGGGDGSEEAGVDGVGVGAADELEFDDVVRGDHAGVAGMELGFEVFGAEPVVDGVDARGDDEDGAGGALGEEVAHGAVEGAGHADGLAGLGEEGEGALDGADGFAAADRRGGRGPGRR